MFTFLRYFLSLLFLSNYLGLEEHAKIRCPYNTLGDYDYTHTASSGTVACTGEDTLDMCADNKKMKFDYNTCPTKVAYSGKVFCVLLLEPWVGFSKLTTSLGTIR